MTDLHESQKNVMASENTAKDYKDPIFYKPMGRLSEYLKKIFKMFR